VSPVPQDQRQRACFKHPLGPWTPLIGSGLFKLGPPPGVFIERTHTRFFAVPRVVGILHPAPVAAQDAHPRLLVRGLFVAHLRRLRVPERGYRVIGAASRVSVITHSSQLLRFVPALQPQETRKRRSRRR